MKTRGHRLFLTLLVSILSVSPAWAVQAHGGAEGLVSHQVGHLLFLIGTGYMLVRVHLLGERGRGWFEFKTFLWLIIIWNLLTFFGHWRNEYIGNEHFVQSGSKTLSFVAHNSVDLLYYLSRLDHLILVPAMFFLVRALKKWSAQS